MRNGIAVRTVVAVSTVVGSTASVPAAALSAQEAPRCTSPTSRDPSWSPDGGSLVFTSDRAGSYDLWALNLRTHELRRLTVSPASEFYPMFSPDGRRVAFTHMENGTQRVGLLDLGGGSVRMLTEADDDAADPSWMPDGRLVYSSGRGGRRDLWVMDANGSDARRLFALDGDEWAPRLSPDGRRVLFQSDPEGDVDLFSIRLDGTELRNLTHRPGFDGVASWSPDGQRVAFYSRTLPSDTTSAALRASWLTAELFVVDADGSGPPRAITDNRHRDQSPTWSPDGSRIAFTSCGSGSLEVWTTDASGTADRQMTHTPAEALRAGRGSSPDDSLEVVSVVERYVRGWREGNVALLREVFAPQGVLVWMGDEGVRTITFEQILVNRRLNPGYGEPWRLVALRIVDGRIAIAEVDISLPTEDIEYTDMLTLYEIDGRWMIVNKAYSLRRGG